MFGATEFQQRPQFEIIPKALFFTLASNTNLVQKAAFNFFLLKTNNLWRFHPFLKKEKTKTKFSRQSWTKHL